MVSSFSFIWSHKVAVCTTYAFQSFDSFRSNWNGRSQNLEGSFSYVAIYIRACCPLYHTMICWWIFSSPCRLLTNGGFYLRKMDLFLSYNYDPKNVTAINIMLLLNGKNVHHLWTYLGEFHFLDYMWAFHTICMLVCVVHSGSDWSWSLVLGLCYFRWWHCYRWK